MNKHFWDFVRESRRVLIFIYGGCLIAQTGQPWYIRLVFIVAFVNLVHDYRRITNEDEKNES